MSKEKLQPVSNRYQIYISMQPGISPINI